MYQTTLQLVKGRPVVTSGKPGIIGTNNSVHDIEISDMTLDCNLTRQSMDADGYLALMTASAAGFGLGSRIRLRRVRIINWGTHTPSEVNGIKQDPNTFECFPIFIVSGADGASGEAVVEDCIIEQPALSQARESTLILNRAHKNSPNILATIGNNYINGDYTTGAPPPAISVASLAESPAGKVKFVTQWPHRVQAGDFVHVTGCASNPNYNGRHKVDSADDFREFRIDKGSLGALPTDSGITVQRYVPRAMPVTVSRSGNVATVTTPLPHLRIAGDYVRIAGIKIAGSPGSPLINPFNGCFKVAAGPTEYSFTYVMDSTPSSNPDTDSEIWLDRWPSERIVIDPSPALPNPPWNPCDGIEWVANADPAFLLLPDADPGDQGRRHATVPLRYGLGLKGGAGGRRCGNRRLC